MRYINHSNPQLILRIRMPQIQMPQIQIDALKSDSWRYYPFRIVVGMNIIRTVGRGVLSIRTGQNLIFFFFCPLQAYAARGRRVPASGSEQISLIIRHLLSLHSVNHPQLIDSALSEFHRAIYNKTLSVLVKQQLSTVFTTILKTPCMMQRCPLTFGMKEIYIRT